MTAQETGIIGLCIDSYEGGVLEGRIFSALREEATAFRGAVALIKRVNELLDEADRPQATMICRSFTGEMPRIRHEADPRRFNCLEVNYKGNTATFSLRIVYRQNASWQGELRWLEEDRQESFRSFMEFLLLIDSACRND